VAHGLGLPSLTVNLLTLLGIGVILFTMDAALALFVLIPVPFIVLLLVRYRQRSHRLYHKNWRRNADVVARFSDVIPNYPVVKSFAREEKEEFDGLLNRLYDAQVSVVTMNAMYWPSIALMTSLATVAIWWFGGNQVIAGHIQLGIIIAFIAYLTLFYQPINNLSNIIPFIQQAITSGERVREILETPSDIRAPEHPEKPSSFSTLEMKDVSFGYEKYSSVLRDFNLKVNAGERIAIAGKSGSGKSTVAKLVMRFYDVDTGYVSIGGVDVRKMDPAYLRAHIGYVPQESVLFDASVAYNIKYGSLREGEPWEIISAAMAAGIHEEIMSMPLAYDTNLGERGNFLSGGQKQRISIARAMYKRPDMVIFDEATSNLDAVNEKMIYSAMKRLCSGRTSIFITHNLREIMDADRVVVMEGGRKVEEGEPRELIERAGHLYSMIREELSGFSWESEKNPATLEDYVEGMLCREKMTFAQSNGSTVDMLHPLKIQDLIPKLPFPISAPNFVMFYSLGKPVLIAPDFTKLCDGGSEHLIRAIRANNFKTEITSVKRVSLTGEELEWFVITKEGREISFNTRGRRNIMMMDWGIVLVDVHENIYEMRYSSMDARSRKLLQQIL
jgi:ATP-binding cassette subfamily C protein